MRMNSCLGHLHEFDQLMIKMHMKLEGSKHPTKVTWTPGQPVAARFSEDDQFHRAKIIGFTGTGIEVFKFALYHGSNILDSKTSAFS